MSAHALRHHPANGLLLAHAAGANDVAMRVLIATHLSFCASCRGVVAAGEAVAGAQLDEIVPVALRTDALENVLARLGEQERAPISNDNAAGDQTPAPLRAFMGRGLSDMPWRRMGPKLAYVPLYRRGGVAMRLLRGAPGADVGRHSHHGMEYTLVLAGGYTDQTGQYGPGDFQTATPGLAHNPRADDDDDCINLAVTTAPLKFDGIVPAIAGKLFGF